MARKLQYFNPDPQIPDSDLLGFGDLMYDDGSTEYLSDDPEMAAGLPRPEPMGPPQAFGPPEAPAPATFVAQEDGQTYEVDPTGNIRPYEGVQDPNTGELLDPGAPSNFLPAMGAELGNAIQGYPEPMGQAWDAQMGGPEEPAQPPQIEPATFVAQEDGQTYQVDPTGNITPAAQASTGMQPVQREGALPPDVAARQQSDMLGMQQQTLAATEQARGEEGRLYNELVLKQMATNEAQRIAAEQEVADQQAKVERFQREQQDLAEQDVATDLISARGPIGAAFGVIGAALLGAVGSDAGLRMIDKAIDQNVRLQVQQKGTKLGLLADKIGSAQVAIKLGKAAIYDAAIRHGELLMQKTKGDVYEAQTPEILQKMREKGLAEMQEAERLSLGRTIEKVPLPAAPPNPAALEKYGELRRERDASTDVVRRMENQIGLTWQPGKNGQPGMYTNKSDVIKNGIEGVGAIEQWVPDFVYSTMGQKDGYQVRGAKQAIAYAAVRQMQPTGMISDVDRKVGEIASTLDTEEGLVQTLERLRNGEEQQQTHDAAEFSPGVVGEYERRRQQSGGQPADAGGGRPVSSRPATTEEKRQAMGSQSKRADVPPNASGDATPEEFENAVAHYAEQSGLNPEAVSRVIRHESGGKPGVTNKLTNKHAGLIQFSKETWAGLAKDMGRSETWDDMRQMSAEEQLPFVMEYFKRAGLDATSDPGDYALAGFMPAYLDAPDDFVLGAKDSKEKIGGLSMHKVWLQNPGLRNGDVITAGDVRRSVL